MMGEKERRWVDPSDYTMVDILGFGKRHWFS
jgi:hypothetical protein